jgi:hypothetical protein
VLQRSAAAQPLRQAAEAASQPQRLQLLQLAYAVRHLAQAVQGEGHQVAAAGSLEEVLR